MKRYNDGAPMEKLRVFLPSRKIKSRVVSKGEFKGYVAVALPHQRPIAIPRLYPSVSLGTVESKGQQRGDMSAAAPDPTPPAETAGGEDSKDSKPKEQVEPQGVGLDEAFDKYAKRGWPDGEDGKTPMLDAYGLREALAMMKIVLKDGEVVDLLDSLGRNRIDFAAFVDVCRSRKSVYEEREQRKVETAAAFEAIGGEDGGKVDAQRY